MYESHLERAYRDQLQAEKASFRSRISQEGCLTFQQVMMASMCYVFQLRIH